MTVGVHRGRPLPWPVSGPCGYRFFETGTSGVTTAAMELEFGPGCSRKKTALPRWTMNRGTSEKSNPSGRGLYRNTGLPLGIFRITQLSEKIK